MKTIRLLAISGSLREASANSRLIQALNEMAPDKVAIKIYRSMGDLPHFNPDLDRETPPIPVLDLRASVGNAHGLIISSPEYAHGVPGSLKNALDWLVASSEFPEKPIMLIGGGEYAQAQLTETLKTMSGRVLINELIQSPIMRGAFNQEGQLTSEEMKEVLRRTLNQFIISL